MIPIAILKERFGLREQTLRLVQARQVVQTMGVIGVSYAESFLADRERFHVERLGLREQTLRIVQDRQVVQACGVGRVLYTETSCGSPVLPGRAARPSQTNPAAL